MEDGGEKKKQEGKQGKATICTFSKINFATNSNLDDSCEQQGSRPGNPCVSTLIIAPRGSPVSFFAPSSSRATGGLEAFA